MKNKISILFITNIPSPYRVSFFNELGKLSELTVLFEKSKSDERNDSWKNYLCENFHEIILNGISTGTDRAFCVSVIGELKKGWDKIIVANTSTPTGMLAIQYMKFHKIPYWIEGDGGFAKSGKGFKEKMKMHFIKGASGYFSTSEAHDQYYITYGAKKNSIYRYPFTSIYDKDVLLSVCKKSQGNREQLGLKENKIILSVGRFSYQKGYGKGFDTLIKTAEILGNDYGIYIVGDTPTDEFIKIVEAKNLYNVHFIDFMSKEILFKYYSLSDVFVLLSRGEAWGLVINEAMACGLPIIATDKCIAGLELIKDGENGFIVPVNSPKITAEKIIKCFEDNNLQEFGLNSLKKIKDYTFEKMAERHMEVLSYE